MEGGLSEEKQAGWIRIDKPVRIRVRYSEVDRMNYCYHVNYLEYFELARSDWIRRLWKPYKELEESEHGLVVTEAHLRYRRPAFYDDELEITVFCNEWGASRLNFLYEIRRSGEAAILCEGSTRLCFVNRSGRPIRIPMELKEILDNLATIDSVVTTASC